MILVVEPDLSKRNEILNTVRWIDERHHVAVCDNTYEGLAIVRKTKPEIVFLGPGVNDDLANKVHSQSPGTLIVSVGSSKERKATANSAETIPLDHAAFREVLQRSREPRIKSARKKRTLSRGDALCIMVITQDSLKFQMKTVQGTTLGIFLKQLNYGIVSYALYRNDFELSTSSDTPVLDGDVLKIRLAEPTR